MDDRISLKEFYDGLDIMFQKKDSADTMRYMESWLREAENRADKYGIVAVCNELGGLCRAMGKTDRAKMLYQRVLYILQNLGMENTENYATALINAGDVHLSAGENQEALEYFTRSRDMLIKLGLSGDYRMAALCNNISMIYRQTGEFAEAEKALDTAFNIIRGLPQCRGELATTYVNLGELQVRQNKLEMAKESFLSAEDIFLRDTGGSDVHYSSACAGLGQVYYLTGRYIEAEKYYQKALELIERDFGRVPYYDLVVSNLEKVKEKRRQEAGI
ncbi:MAG: tetratricopeptide repeat protein [Clostridiales bacterium]|nr:tetratricopeptide repeat protein [Clostridiales bacterium]